MGARPMQRLIQDTIRRALADELLFGRLAAGGHVVVGLEQDGKVELTFSKPENITQPNHASPSPPDTSLLDGWVTVRSLPAINSQHRPTAPPSHRPPRPSARLAA